MLMIKDIIKHILKMDHGITDTKNRDYKQWDDGILEANRKKLKSFPPL